MKITRHRGFQMTFENGWTASVQWGPGTYTDHHYDTHQYDDPEYAERWESTTAEVAAWPEGGSLIELEGGDTVRGYLTADQVLAFLNEVAAR